MDLKDHIRGIPDFPKPGILFYDISTLLRDADAWQVAMGRMARMVRPHLPDLVAGIELAEAGFAVAVHERRPVLGGRASSSPTADTTSTGRSTTPIRSRRFSGRSAFQNLCPQTYSQRVEKGFLGDRSKHMRIRRLRCGGKRFEIDMSR